MLNKHFFEFKAQFWPTIRNTDLSLSMTLINDYLDIRYISHDVIPLVIYVSARDLLAVQVSICFFFGER